MDVRLRIGLGLGLGVKGSGLGERGGMSGTPKFQALMVSLSKFILSLS